jgi:hypothetical protein
LSGQQETLPRPGRCRILPHAREGRASPVAQAGFSHRRAFRFRMCCGRSAKIRFLDRIKILRSRQGNRHRKDRRSDQPRHHTFSQVPVLRDEPAHAAHALDPVGNIHSEIFRGPPEWRTPPIEGDLPKNVLGGQTVVGASIEPMRPSNWVSVGVPSKRPGLRPIPQSRRTQMRLRGGDELDWPAKSEAVTYGDRCAANVNARSRRNDPSTRRHSPPLLVPRHAGYSDVNDPCFDCRSGRGLLLRSPVDPPVHRHRRARSLPTRAFQNRTDNRRVAVRLWRKR